MSTANCRQAPQRGVELVHVPGVGRQLVTGQQECDQLDRGCARRGGARSRQRGRQEQAGREQDAHARAADSAGSHGLYLLVGGLRRRARVRLAGSGSDPGRPEGRIRGLPPRAHPRRRVRRPRSRSFVPQREHRPRLDGCGAGGRNVPSAVMFTACADLSRRAPEEVSLTLTLVEPADLNATCAAARSTGLGFAARASLRPRAAAHTSRPPRSPARAPSRSSL